jgi:hypothetical protein
MFYSVKLIIWVYRRSNRTLHLFIMFVSSGLLGNCSVYTHSNNEHNPYKCKGSDRELKWLSLRFTHPAVQLTLEEEEICKNNLGT